jgi:RNase P subunit RPR2
MKYEMAFRPFDPTPECLVVTCKGCMRKIPLCRYKKGAPMPTENVIVDCPKCGMKRRYRPSEVDVDRPSMW